MGASSQKYTFRENPKEYCKELYEEFTSHNRELAEKVSKNRDFYNGIDERLEKRKTDKHVKRSALFIHEQRPAIDTGLSAIVDALEEGENTTVQLIPKDGAEDQRDVIENVEARLNEELRDDGFLTSGIYEAMKESRIAPVVFIKVGWTVEEGLVHEIAKGPVEFARKKLEWMRYALGIQATPPQDRVIHHYGTLREGPYSEIKDWDQVAYDPTVHDFQAGRAIIEICRYTYEELEAYAADQDWDMKAVEKMKTDRETPSSPDDTVADRDRESREDDAGARYDDGKYEVAEFYIPFYDEDGKRRIRLYVLGEKDYSLTKEKFGQRTDYTKFPFVAVANNKAMNQVEGIPGVELTKPMQQLYCDICNAINDAVSYGIFPITIAKGDVFQAKPQIAPGALWKVSDIDNIRREPGDSSAIVPLITLFSIIAQKIDQMHNAPDFGQAKNIQEQDEKVFQTKLRAMGSARRARIDFKEAGQAVIAVAKWFIELHRIHGHVEWVFDANIDTPALTGNYTPQEEQQKMALVVETANQLQALYGTPIGREKLRNLVEQYYQKLRIRNIDNILITPEEMQTEDPILNTIKQVMEQANNQPNGSPGQVGGDIGQSEGEVQNAVV